MCVGKRNKSRPFRTERDLFVDSLKLLMSDVDLRGDLKDWVGCAQNKNVWTKMVNERMQIRYGDFSESNTNTEEDAPNSNQNSNTLSKNISSSLYGEERHNVTPGREYSVWWNMTRREALTILNCCGDKDNKETYRKHRALERKYHPDKWSEEYMFDRDVGEDIFKSIANAYEILTLRKWEDTVWGTWVCSE